MAYQQTLPVDTELIGDFRILGLLGSGGFANTYLALDLTLGREVAIKEFFPSDLAIRGDSKSVSVRSMEQEAQFKWAMGRFVREAKTLAQFRHPSVVRVHRVFNANDTAYIVLEFVRGANMGAWLKRLPGPPTQAELDVLLPPLLDALEVVHNAGILHRDIKPANIYIREVDQTPVLLDFGAAKYAASAGADQAGTTAAIVSKGYSPNEAYATDSRLQGPWTDIYGLGATLYRALTGLPPPESTSRILHDECVPAMSIPALVGNYRPEFLSAIDRSLGIIPKSRPQSVAEWRGEILPHGLRQSQADTQRATVAAPEWHPLESPSDAATVYSRNHSHGATGTGGPSAAPASAPSVAASGTRKPSTPSISAGPAAAIDDLASSSITTIPPPAAAISRPATSNRILLIGLALFVAGTGGLLAQWLTEAPPERQAGRDLRATSLETRREADPRIAEDTRKREQQEAADRKAREEAESQRQARAAAEAERARKAEEARQADLAAAEAQRKRQAQEDAERTRKAEEEERTRRAEEEQRVARAAAEEERRKQEESRKNAEAAGAAPAAPDGKTAVAAVTPAAVAPSEADRGLYLTKMQTALKNSRCYDGSVNGDLGDAITALATFQNEFKGTPQPINLATATTGNFESWLAWFATLDKFECSSAQAASGGELQKLSALTPPAGVASDADRRLYLANMQTALKNRHCYDGSVNGELGDAITGLATFQTKYKGTLQPINLATATPSDFENWLTWFKALEKFECEPRAASEAADGGARQKF